MKTYVVVSATGKDRPGFVNRVVSVIHGLNGNVELQRSLRMADEFALIALFSLPGPNADADAAIAALKQLQSEDLSINARHALVSPEERPSDARTAVLEASGADQPGIIEAVTMLLYKSHANIESMNYDTEAAPFTGEHLFRMTAELAFPASADVESLEAQLGELEAEMNFDTDLKFTGP